MGVPAMLTHVLRMSATTALVLLCSVLPFLPGQYDSLAVPLSAMAQALGIAGLLLVPVGAVWLAYEYRSRRAGGEASSLRRGMHRLGTATLLAGATVCVVVALSALASAGLSAALGVLALSGLGLSRIARRLRALGSVPRGGAVAVPVYLLVVPVAVALLQAALVGPAIAFSRDRAIRNSAPLIAAIERYRATRGYYPPSLLSVWEDYDPSVIGISRYFYEPSGDAYNLVFEQFQRALGVREFVVYNPRDQQVMTSHNADLLELTPAELEPRRGFNNVHATQHPHWRYFWFD
jgi:hypothetical protein